MNHGNFGGQKGLSQTSEFNSRGLQGRDDTKALQELEAGLWWGDETRHKRWQRRRREV